MTANFIRLQDDHTGGGKAISASSTMRYGGRFVVRKGDDVTCPKHPDVSPNKVIEGDEKTLDRNIPVARHGASITCGCRMISSLL